MGEQASGHGEEVEQPPEERAADEPYCRAELLAVTTTEHPKTSAQYPQRIIELLGLDLQKTSNHHLVSFLAMTKRSVNPLLLPSAASSDKPDFGAATREEPQRQARKTPN